MYHILYCTITIYNNYQLLGIICVYYVPYYTYCVLCTTMYDYVRPVPPLYQPMDDLVNRFLTFTYRCYHTPCSIVTHRFIGSCYEVSFSISTSETAMSSIHQVSVVTSYVTHRESEQLWTGDTFTDQMGKTDAYFIYIEHLAPISYIVFETNMGSIISL